MNDRERELWVPNDEDLYLAFRSYGGGISTFIRENRRSIDAAIRSRRRAE